MRQALRKKQAKWSQLMMTVWVDVSSYIFEIESSASIAAALLLVGHNYILAQSNIFITILVVLQG